MQSTTLAARPSTRAARRPFGFTLIELMIVVAVIAILAIIALPQYAEHVRKGKRAEALQALGDLQLRQESWRADHPSYGAMTDLFTDGGTAYNGGLKNYTVTIPASASTSYTILATRKGDLANDPKCGNFRLRMASGVISKEITTGDANYCWRK
ncbi:MAG: prepilin-type N-terminal cleavage/methylation domain-containing protein [Lysobacter sp.]|nr:prepilin-type N-terminal cleavage/methylation domain-containing protein [Lysobacter sp.]